MPLDDEVEISSFAEGLPLSELVDYIAETLEINIAVKGPLTGEVMFNAPKAVPRARLLDLLEALLDQHNYSLVLDRAGFYRIQPIAEVPAMLEGDYATTRIISTPSVRPSALREAVSAYLGTDARAAATNIAYLDDMGVIVMTDAPRRVRGVEELVARLDPPRIVWMMVPAGAAVDDTIARLAAIVGEGAILVDGGNSHYRDTIRRAGAIRSARSSDRLRGSSPDSARQACLDSSSTR